MCTQLRTVDMRQRGFSVVELMVAITVALFILAGMGLAMANSSKSRAELERALQQIENGRFAMQLLAEDLRHAGYYGRYLGESGAPVLMPNPCAVDLAGLDAGMKLPVQGYDSLVTLPAELSACLDDRNFVPGTDILVVRRAQAGAPIEVADVAPGRIYLQSTAYPSGPRYVLGNGADPSVFTLQEKSDDHSGTIVAAGLQPYVVHVYFVSPCDVPASGEACTGAGDDDGRPIPTLKRLELTSDGMATPVMRVVPLVEGVQNLQIDYGIDYPPVGSSVGDGSPDNYVTDPLTPGDWANVVAVRLNLLAANTEDTRGHLDTKRYNLGLAGSVGPFNDEVKRHAYSAVVRVNNVSGQREN